MPLGYQVIVGPGKPIVQRRTAAPSEVSILTRLVRCIVQAWSLYGGNISLSSVILASFIITTMKYEGKGHVLQTYLFIILSQETYKDELVTNLIFEKRA